MKTFFLERKMPKRLILLSDLWGKERSDWINPYFRALSNNFDIQYYDVQTLGNINVPDSKTEGFLHQAFINGGIDEAVKNILQKETQIIDVLAFSIGGTIAWKAALEGLKVNRLVCVSSTRLRYETQQPHCKIKLFYGELDDYKPSKEWLNTMKLSSEIIPNEDHEFYRNQQYVSFISQEII